MLRTMPDDQDRLSDRFSLDRAPGADMSRYIFGKPAPARPFSSAGYWHDEPCVLSMQTRTRIKIIIRPPADRLKPGADISADGFEPALRQMVADTLLGAVVEGFEIVGANVEQFEDAGG